MIGLRYLITREARSGIGSGPRPALSTHTTHVDNPGEGSKIGQELVENPASIPVLLDECVVRGEVFLLVRDA